MGGSGGNTKAPAIGRGLMRATNVGGSHAVYVQGSIVQAGGDVVRVKDRDAHIHF